MKKRRVQIVLWLLSGVLFSVLLGMMIGVHLVKGVYSAYVRDASKLGTLLRIIDRQYVDSIDIHEMTEEIVPYIFDRLDPHSVYIPAGDVKLANDEMEGTFSGIGVSFNMQTDTILVIGVVAGGPSEKAGIMPFDRIVSINDSVYVGKGIASEDIIKKLRGEKKSKVKLGVRRRDRSELLIIEVTRDDIPTASVDAAYVIERGIGYIKVGKFTRNTYAEFITSLAKLKGEGCKSFIIDLRGNAGGIMASAIKMVNEFLSKGQLIVYTEGKAYPRDERYADGHGSCIDAPIVVLTDEGSASASEIFAGAIQDNDRGLIIGRRTYGKALVQAPIELSDSSQVNLTIARYYTPSGRSIQKKYELGHTEEYDRDIYNRYLHGEFYTADSIKTDSLPAYKTMKGRTVFGGGGIMPDIFIPSDTSGASDYFNQVTRNGSNLLHLYTLLYSDAHYARLATFGSYRELHAYLQGQPLLADFTDYAASRGITKQPAAIRQSARLIETYLYAYIVRNFFQEAGFYPILNADDATLRRAVDVIKDGQTLAM